MLHIRDYREGFPLGWTSLTRHDEKEDNTRISFSIVRFKEGEEHSEITQDESAFLLMSGKVEVQVGDKSASFNRSSLFDESASGIHVSRGVNLRFLCRSDVEISVYRCPNEKEFPSQIYYPDSVSTEHRGYDRLNNTAYRFVRTIFDDTNADTNAELILGEVINMQGSWSSYPPHSHPHAEIYHYRFTRPEGYGHAELGDDVYKVRHYDTIKILNGNGHAQCSAPGYGMYYSWAIRDLPNLPYTGFEFLRDHAWAWEEDSPQFWTPNYKTKKS